MNKTSLRFKVLSLLAGSMLALALVCLGALYFIEDMGEKDLTNLETNLTKVNKISEIKNLFGIQIQEWKNTIIRGAKAEENAKHAAAFDKMSAKILGIAGDLRGQLSDERAALLNDFIKNQTELKEKYISTREKYLGVANFRPAEADAAVKGVDRKVLDSLTLLDKKITEQTIKTSQESRAHMRKNLIFIIAIVSTILFLSLYLGQIIISRITSGIAVVADSLLNNATSVKNASVGIASSSEELSQAATEQAASLQETSASIEEISSMINANTENAKQSTHLSEQSLATAERGREVVSHMISAIGEINTSNDGIMNQINETNKEIEKIVQIINEIGAKTKVINDIVFQTKLLSFNASVEAARAGEQGKGFAVVAQEIGNLASMSGTAALEIDGMLGKSVKTVEGIVRESKEKISHLIANGKEKVETGTKVANECEKVLIDIVSSVESVTKMVTEISIASQEQAQGVHEITKAVAQLDQVTQQNTANATQGANAAGNLSGQAEELNLLIQSLVQTINGATNSVKEQRKQSHVIHHEHEVKNKATETDEFNFDDAIQAHVAWKQKLLKYIQMPDNSLNPDEVCLDNKCPLGKWIYGEGVKYSRITEYQKLKPAHAKFHKEAAEIIRKVNTGVQVTEEVALSTSSPFTNASKEVVSIILGLKGKINKGTNVRPLDIMTTEINVASALPVQKVSNKPLKDSSTTALPAHDDERFVDV